MISMETYNIAWQCIYMKTYKYSMAIYDKHGKSQHSRQFMINLESYNLEPQFMISMDTYKYNMEFYDEQGNLQYRMAMAN